MPTEFIKDAGACICSRTILSRQGTLKWLVREHPIEPPDTGWRFFAMEDDSDFINDPDNLAVVDFNTVAEIEPAIIGIYPLGVGSDLQLVENEQGQIRFVDNNTGAVLGPDELT